MYRFHSIVLPIIALSFAFASSVYAADENKSENAPETAAEETTTQAGESDTDHDEMMPNAAATANGIDEPDDEVLKKVFYGFQERFPSLPVESIAEGPYPGWYEIVTDARVVYVDEDLTRLFQGNVIDLTHGVDLTERRMAGIHMGLINELGEENMLVYQGANNSKRSITVFTDINCGYCRLLHSEIDTLIKNGVSVRYLMFPRAGLESDSRVALESVWCADDPQAAMTAAKAGQPITEKACETPVELHYAIAQQVGLRGTPLIYLDNGTAIPGYREASALVEMIQSTEPMQ